GPGYVNTNRSQYFVAGNSKRDSWFDAIANPRPPAIRNSNLSPRLLAGHHALHQPGDNSKDRASSAAADDLTHNGPEIKLASSRACNRRNEGLQNLTSADAANSTGDGIAKVAQIVVLHGGAGGVPTDHSRDQLNDQIGDHLHFKSLPALVLLLRSNVVKECCV